VIISKQIH